MEGQNNIEQNFLKEDKTGMVTIKNKISDCNTNNLFNFLNSHFSIFFLDVRELRRFISYLINKKQDLIIEDLLKNFQDILKEFKER